MSALGVFLLVVAAAPTQADDWAQVWAELETLRSARTSEAEASLLRTQLHAAAREGPDGPRRALLQGMLEALSGRDSTAAAMRLAQLDPLPFRRRELWFLADLLPPGERRSRIVLDALGASTTLSDWQLLLAWNSAVDEARALRLAEGALPIQEDLHERFRAPWSAEDLALTYKALGRGGDADLVLAEAIASEVAAGRRPATLWERRGILAIGLGDERAGRDYLGKAMALGSEDAGLMLSGMDLLFRNTAAARRGFQALVRSPSPLDWAWRGWGISMLPSRHESSAVPSLLSRTE